MSDAVVYDDIKAKLIATGEFNLVRGAEEAGQGPMPSDDPIIATIVSLSARDEDIDAETTQHDCQYEVQIEVRNEDPERLSDVLDRLGNIARNALNRKSLGSLTLPRLTMIDSERGSKSKQPNQTTMLRGSFSYLITDATAYDTTLT